jgi:hypothetical protein
MYGNGRRRARFARHCAKVFTFTFKSFAASSAVNKRSTVYAPSTIPSDQSLPADLATRLRPALRVESRFRSETRSATPKKNMPRHKVVHLSFPYVQPSFPPSLGTHFYSSFPCELHRMVRSKSFSSLPYAYSMLTSETFQSAPPDSWTVPAGHWMRTKSETTFSLVPLH